MRIPVHLAHNHTFLVPMESCIVCEILLYEWWEKIRKRSGGLESVGGCLTLFTVY